MQRRPGWSFDPQCPPLSLFPPTNPQDLPEGLSMPFLEPLHAIDITAFHFREVSLDTWHQE